MYETRISKRSLSDNPTHVQSTFVRFTTLHHTRPYAIRFPEEIQIPLFIYVYRTFSLTFVARVFVAIIVYAATQM